MAMKSVTVLSEPPIRSVLKVTNMSAAFWTEALNFFVRRAVNI
jgi:hypothetical protein